MGIEASRSPLRPKEPEDHLDAMLQEFPEENLVRIEARIAGKPIEEQVSIVEDALKRRREIINRPRYTSPSLKMIERVPDSVFDKFLHKQEHQVEVGRGENGRVFEYEASEESERSVVFKMLIREPLTYQNDLLEEGAYQADIVSFAEKNADLRIGVPQPYYIATSSKGFVLAMEKLPGVSAEEISKKNIAIPAGLDLNEIEASLSGFVHRMNEAGYYHRDLGEGNIMFDLERIDAKAPIAYVIDFGFCTKAANPEEAYEGPNGVDGRRDNVMIKKVIDQLKTRQNRGVQGASI